MAVVVQCYHCSNILELDEGFRGGVCRCSQCGSLLQVPRASAAETGTRERPAAPGARPGRPEAPGAGTGLSRGQFDPRSGGRPGRPEGSAGSGAFVKSPLRETQAGSGGGVGVRKIEQVLPLDAIGGIPSVAVHVRRVKKSRNLLWLGLGLALVVVVAGVVAIVMLMMASTGTEGGTKETSGGGTRVEQGTGGTSTGGRAVSPLPPMTARTGFFGVELTGKQIVIAIDAGQSMQDVYDHVAKGALAALDGMRADQQVRIAIWRTPEPLVLPASGWTNKAGLAELRKEMDDVYASGGHDAETNMAAVMKLGADQTIFITGKTGLSEGLAEIVLKERTGQQRVDCIWITSGTGDSPLKGIAEKTGGKYLTVSGREVEEYYRK